MRSPGNRTACIAAEADDLLAVIAEQVENERIEKQKANAVNQHSEPSDKKLCQPKPSLSEKPPPKPPSFSTRTSPRNSTTLPW